jgi:hypothetical protein
MDASAAGLWISDGTDLPLPQCGSGGDAELASSGRPRGSGRSRRGGKPGEGSGAEGPRGGAAGCGGGGRRGCRDRAAAGRRWAHTGMHTVDAPGFMPCGFGRAVARHHSPLLPIQLRLLHRYQRGRVVPFDQLPDSGAGEPEIRLRLRRRASNRSRSASSVSIGLVARSSAASARARPRSASLSWRFRTCRSTRNSSAPACSSVLRSRQARTRHR